MNDTKRPGGRTRSDMMNLDDGSGDVNNPFLFGTMPTSRSISSRTNSSTSVSKYEPSIEEEDNLSSFREIRPAKKPRVKILRDDEQENMEVVSPGGTESTLEDHRYISTQSFTICVYNLLIIRFSL